MEVPGAKMGEMTILNIPVQMLAVTDRSGKLTPLWFRYENEEHQIVTVKIQQVVSSKEEKHCGMDYISYVCWAQTEQQRRLIELRYRLSTHKWSFFQALS